MQAGPDCPAEEADNGVDTGVCLYPGGAATQDSQPRVEKKVTGDSGGCEVSSARMIVALKVLQLLRSGLILSCGFVNAAGVPETPDPRLAAQGGPERSPERRCGSGPVNHLGATGGSGFVFPCPACITDVQKHPLDAESTAEVVSFSRPACDVEMLPKPSADPLSGPLHQICQQDYGFI
ncbi:hypothetical protein GN956_G11597 [Arapaima gigas]